MTKQERAAELAYEILFEFHKTRLTHVFRFIFSPDDVDEVLVPALNLFAASHPLPPIEREGSREYIPIPGGWEIQTKGSGSSFRLCDTKTGDRLNILGGDGPMAQDFVTRMAKEVRASFAGLLR